MFTRGFLALAAVVSVAAPLTSVATEVTFTLDPSRSSTTLLADILGSRWFVQFPGSDVASYNGTMTVDVDDTFAPTEIQILGANAVTADYPEPMLPVVDPDFPDPFDPGSPAPAVYGLRFTDTGLPDGTDVGYLTLRDVVLGVTTKEDGDMGLPVVEPVDVDGNFSSLSLEFEAISAIADAWIAILYALHDDLGRTNPDGSQSFRNDDPNNPPEPPLDGGSWPVTADSSYVVSGNTATLTIVVNSHDYDDEFRDMYEGVLVGTASLATFNEADFNQDGSVDGDDFLLWQTGFGTPSGATKIDGDFDSDEDVDGDDFLGWQANFGSGEGAGSVAVPEPTSLFLAWAALSGAAALVRRRRH